MLTAMPSWDLSTIFPAVDSPELKVAVTKLENELSEAENLCSRHSIGEGEPSTDSSLVPIVLDLVNQIGLDLWVLKAYLGCTVAADSTDEKALAKDSETDVLYVRFNKLMTRVNAWAGKIQPEDTLGHSHFFERAKVKAIHQMSPAEEALAADLATTGGVSWGRLHGNVGSLLLVDVELATGVKTMPMSAVRNLAFDPSADVRQRAFEAELAGWKSVEIPMAAAMNGIKGEVGLLAKRRGWNSALDEALFAAAIDRETLEAMLGAARESFPDFQRYLKAKAKLIGKEVLDFSDLFAPVGKEREWSVEEAENFVEEKFRGYSDRMADYAVRAFRERWVDYEPRHGKRDGAFCEGFGSDLSRVFMNFKPSYKSVSTLAHELGHAYHNLCAAERTYLQRETPMTLAETASIFCEMIVKGAALTTGSDDERLSVLEAALSGQCQVVVDITSRFLFESSMFEGRATRDLSASEMCGFMAAAQKETYGDGLNPDALHPFMWAAKPHYYSTWSFYNFPYMFGQLFSLGLYAIYEAEPNGFHRRYDDLLAATGMADAATLAADFGIDIRKPDFWRASLDVIRADIRRFEGLVG